MNFEVQQIVDFILELDKLKGVTRKTRPLGLDRYENSAEHSWHIAHAGRFDGAVRGDTGSTSIA